MSLVASRHISVRERPATEDGDDEEQLLSPPLSTARADETLILVNESIVENADSEEEDVNVLNNEPDANEEEQSEATEEQPNPDSPIEMLTRRLRCVFRTLTCPILPLGMVAFVFLFSMLHVALFVEHGECSHPLRGYAFFSLLGLFIFGAVEADCSRNSNPDRRFWDPVMNTMALLYLYGGMTLVQTCRDDVVDVPDKQDNEVVLNSCQMTCPILTRAVTFYVTSLELFALSILLPLLLLPCISVCLLILQRRAILQQMTETADPETLALLRQQWRYADGDEDDDNLDRRRATVQDVMAHLQPVNLVRTGVDDSGDDKVTVVPLEEPEEQDDSSAGRIQKAVELSLGRGNAMECCICMSDFVVHDDDEDLEAGQPDDAEEVIVRTEACGHLFHRQCIIGWVAGGQWRNFLEDESRHRRRRQYRARRTTCPLCRHDLRPRERGGATRSSGRQYNTFST